MNDLELCKKIAEIEGFEYTTRRDSVCPCDPTDVIKHKSTDIYNPLTDKALLLDLIFKHEIDLSFSDGLALVKRKNVGWGVTAMKVSKADAPRAVLECIIQANEQKGE